VSSIEQRLEREKHYTYGTDSYVSIPEWLNVDEEFRDGREEGSLRREEMSMTRVLVIDDDRSVGSAIEMLLARQGFDTFLTLDSHAGVQALESSKFDVVMIDIFMPGIDGLKTIKNIREGMSTVPIVAMSGFRFRNSTPSAPDFLGMAAKLGATCCLRKPFTPQALMAAINLCLNPVLSSAPPGMAENQGKDSVDEYGQFRLRYPAFTVSV
jgi:DNA-binding response OmpR family regulator